MRDGRRYRISKWSVFALLITPLAAIASVIVVAALEQPGNQADGLHQLMAEMVRKLGVVPARD